MMGDEVVQQSLIIQQKSDPSFPNIVIDGVFFQLNQTGIARVWHSLLLEWSQSDFARHILVLDRGNTVPKISKIAYLNINTYDYRYSAIDSQQLQAICHEVGADVFISTYYTTPLTTPSVFMAYDMIPEVMQLDLQEPCWQEKHYGILQAARYLTISQNTANDLVKFFPHIHPEWVTVAHCGVAKTFKPAIAQEIQAFRTQYGIYQPYFLLVGSRLTLKGYKNATLFFRAFSNYPQRQAIAIVCVGGAPELEPELAAMSAGINVHLLNLNDAELRLAYAGAIALVYPSRYEGFGLPIAEAMACGCPVITCANSSIPEVAGKAALYVNEDSVEEMLAALEEVQLPSRRESLIQKGFEQVRQFSWSKMAAIVAERLLETARYYQHQPTSQSALLWQAFRQEQAYRQHNQPLESKVSQLEQQNEQLRQAIHQLEQDIQSLSTPKTAARKLLKAGFQKIGLYELARKGYSRWRRDRLNDIS